MYRVVILDKEGQWGRFFYDNSLSNCASNWEIIGV